MSDFRDPALPAEPDPGSDEALSAYLQGELGDADAAAFEGRVAADPSLAARLDALAEALAVLGGLDQVAEPDGFAGRLDTRLEAESQVSEQVSDLDARRRRRWSAVLTAAAGVAILAVAGIQVLTPAVDDSESAQVAADFGDDDQAVQQRSALSDGSGSAGGGTAAEEYSAESAPAPVPLEQTRDSYRGEAYSGEADSGEADGSSGGGAPAASSAQEPGPLFVDEGADLRDDEDLRARYIGTPETERLRGMPRAEADRTAARHADHVRAAGPFSSGVRPDTCLDAVRGGPDGRIVARVELLAWQGGEALAYVLASPRPGSGHVDRFEVWVVGPHGCDTRRALTWE